MLHRGLQHRDGRRLLAGGGLRLGHLTAQRVSRHVVLPHLLGKTLSLGVGLIQRRLGLVTGLLGLSRIALQLQLGGPQVLQLLQPHGDLQHPQLIPQHQILLRRLRLRPQRLHLQFQLGDLVVDTHQVFLGALQLALGLLLAVPVFADTGGLLEDLPALAAFHRQYLVDLALSDNGVALPAHAGVHEQLVHVLQPHGLLIDIVLRLTAAVIPPCHGHLCLLPGREDMLGVVDDQRHLGKAHLVPLLRTAEDHVLHLGAAELAAVLLAHDPAYGVGDVGLAGPVWSHDSGDVLAEIQYRLVGETLEPLYLKCF